MGFLAGHDRSEEPSGADRAGEPEGGAGGDSVFYANAAAIGLSSVFPSETGDDIEDDHLPLIQRGIPTLDRLDFEYPYWHTIQDTPEHCSEAALESTGVALESFLTLKTPFDPRK